MEDKNLTLNQKLTLCLIKLNSWEEEIKTPDRETIKIPRAWKGYDFDDLNVLNELGLIDDKVGRKSVYLTEEGVKMASELLKKIENNCRL